MKVCYIWAQKYKNLINFELNLSSLEKFSYDNDKNIVSYSLCAELPEDFFPSRINDVIAIIGKNGSGKSNALELICNTLKGGKSSAL